MCSQQLISLRLLQQISEWFAIVYIITRGFRARNRLLSLSAECYQQPHFGIDFFYKLALRDESERNERQGKAIAKAHENHFRVDGEFSCSTSCFYGKRDWQESNEKRYR